MRSWGDSGALPPRALTSGIPDHHDTMTTVPPITPPGVITQEFHTPRADKLSDAVRLQTRHM
jgi:hypothetical protein